MSDKTSRTRTSFDLSCLSAKSYSIHEWDLVVARRKHRKHKVSYTETKKKLFSRPNLFSPTGSWSVKTIDLISGVIYTATTFVILSKSIGWITNCRRTENSMLDTTDTMHIIRMRRNEWYCTAFVICILMSSQPIDDLCRIRGNNIEFISSPD